MITLIAEARWGHEGKQYVARITGRDPKYTFRREFVGKKGGKHGGRTEADLDTPGLYEVRDIGKKGERDDTYALLVELADGRLAQHACSKEQAMQIAKDIDAGRQFGEIVDVDVDSETGGWEYVPARKAEAKQAARTIDQATDAAWQILQGLPVDQAEKVLAALKARLTPPKPAKAVGLDEDAPAGAPAGVIVDASGP